MNVLYGGGGWAAFDCEGYQKLLLGQARFQQKPLGAAEIEALKLLYNWRDKVSELGLLITGGRGGGLSRLGSGMSSTASRVAGGHHPSLFSFTL